MSIITETVYESGYQLGINLDALREQAYEACQLEAERRNLYISSAMENLSLYNNHEPEPAEVATCLSKDRQGDWKAVITMAATLATLGHLEAEVESDLNKLEKAIHEASLAGYEAKRLYSSCAHGWAAHDSESDWEAGTLYEWKRLDGEIDAAMLRVTLSEGAEVWIDLAWVN